MIKRTGNCMKSGIVGVLLCASVWLTASAAQAAVPEIDPFVTGIQTDSAVLNAEIDPSGDNTTYRFEWGVEANLYSNSVPVPDGSLSTATDSEIVSQEIVGLTPGTTYHYRITAQNGDGTEVGDDQTFTTFVPPLGEDSCANSFVRQQTSAAQLLDCRAYELVSAEDTGGYNVESDIVARQSPFGGYPRSEGRALYGVHSGAVPGPWTPTNRGVDPYVATRGKNGWTTEYVGLPADLLGATGPFASPLAGADENLTSFAFGGEGICDPCFDDGTTNVPLRLPDGTLIQGMAGSIDVSGDPSGVISKHFSTDGSHFLFGSTASFEGDANSSGLDVTIYDRDLITDQTQVVSKLPNGDTIANGAGVAALDISADGSRIVIGSLVSTDAKGNDRYQLYMHVNGAPGTIDLTPGTSSGAIYNGMAADGTRVYFTTTDPLTTAAEQDTDTSADIFRADVSGGSATLSRVSTGPSPVGPGNTDSCTPPATTTNTHWNTVDATADCSAAAIAGGGGVATDSSDLYFLSPEILDTSDPQNLPVHNSPNLYLSQPGHAPRFVATLESKEDQLGPELTLHTESGSFGSFTNGTGIAFAPNGTLYIYENTKPARIRRYTTAGVLVSSITSGLNGQTGNNFDVPAQIGTDAITGTLYVPNGNLVRRYNNAGSFLGSLQANLLVSAAAVNPVDGNVYVGLNYPQSGQIYVLSPTGTQITTWPAVLYVRGIAFDSMGRVYVASISRTALYTPSGEFIRTVAVGGAYGVAVDPTNNDVFVDQGNRVLHLSASGAVAGTVDIGDVTTGRSIVVRENHRLYLIEGGNNGQVRWYDAQPAADLRIDNPAVVHAVNDAGTRHTEDFQVNPDGSFALFSSTLPLDEVHNRRRSVIYRYSPADGRIECPSCSASSGSPTTDTTLASDGLNLSDDGRVFFTSGEALVLRDSNGHRDAYEWNEGVVELISPGLSPYDSTLLSASADGTDAFFFTRDTLVHQDRNRTLVKLYDARADGGFAFIPPAVPCRASDECHGPSSPAPPPLGIPTISGSGGNATPAAPRCKRGKVRRRGRCVRRKGGKPRRRGGRTSQTGGQGR
jgi:hypothetical protein